MSLRLITTSKGTPHISAPDDGTMNQGIVGTRDYVLRTGEQLRCEAVSDAAGDRVRIYDGDICMQGRHIKLPAGEHVDLAFNYPQNGYKRIDLVICRFTRNSSTGAESVEFDMITGSQAATSPEEPEYTEGEINEISGDLINEMPLYSLYLSTSSAGSTSYTITQVCKKPYGIADLAETIYSSGINIVNIGESSISGVKTEDGSIYAFCSPDPDNDFGGSYAVLEAGACYAAFGGASIGINSNRILINSGTKEVQINGNNVKVNGKDISYPVGDLNTTTFTEQYTCGTLTGNAHTIYFSVPLGRIIPTNNIRIRQLTLCARHVGGGYVIGTSGPINVMTGTYNVNASIAGESIRFSVQKADGTAFSATNNTPIAINVGLLEFWFGDN